MGFDWGLFLAALVTTGLAWAVTWAVRRYAGKLALLHAPNGRSSHAELTPHGGGLAIVVAGILAAFGLGMADSDYALVMLGLALAIALLGLWDDIWPLSVAPRLLVHVLVCGLAVVWLGDAPGVVGLALLLVAGVWWVNLFNFMDGIDGLASVQALFMLIVGAALAAGFSPEAIQFVTWRWMWLLAAATLGFVLHNWPPARIFMGDVGSTFLGFVLFALALISHREGWLPFSVWLILGTLFVVDATVTLLIRMSRRERWYEAHRSHIYQRLALKLGGHLPVTLLALAINLGFLAPLAYLVMAHPDLTWLGLGLAYGLLTVAVLWLHSSGYIDSNIRQRTSDRTAIMKHFSSSPREMFASAWRNRELIVQMTKREVVGRYRGSVFGIVWSFFNPILMLTVYTFVFSVVFKARWHTGSDSKTEFAIVLFAGMIVFSIFAECINRAPSLVLANPNYVRKVVFPLEIMPWVALGASLFHAVVSLVVLLVFVLIVNHALPWTLVLTPLVLLPLFLFPLGSGSSVHWGSICVMSVRPWASSPRP